MVAIFMLLQTGAAGGEAIPLGDGGYASALFRMIFYLALICGVIYVALRFLMPRLFRWRMPGAGPMRIVDQLQLGSGKSIGLVKAVGRYYLISIAEGNVRLLKELEASEVEELYPSARKQEEQKRS